MAIIRGTGGDNVLEGTPYFDSISGLEGSDTIYGYRGADYLIGGTPGFTGSSADENDKIYGGEGNDTILGGGSDFNYADADDGDDVLDGGNGNDTIYDFGGANTISAGAGDDRVTAGYGTTVPESGNYTILRNDNIVSYSVDLGSGDDYLLAKIFASDTFTVDGGVGVDTVELDFTYISADLVITLGASGSIDGASVTLENIERAIVATGQRMTTFNGGDGDDELITGQGCDGVKFSGGGGDDSLWARSDVETTADGGSGSDTIQISLTRAMRSFDFKDGIFGKTKYVNFENLICSVSSGAGTVVGGDGSDQIRGGFGNDTLVGGAGEDRLTGNYGRDTLTGSAGSDRFFFNVPLGEANEIDTITDFEHRDLIEILRGYEFGALHKGRLEDFRFKVIGYASQKDGVDKTDRILYDRDDGNLYVDQDGVGTEYAPIRFAVVKDNTYLDAADFLFV